MASIESGSGLPGGTEICATCGKKDSEEARLLRCTGCQSVRYCDRECQKKGWKAHKKTCKPPKYKTRDPYPRPPEGVDEFTAQFNYELAGFMEHQRALLTEVLSQAIVGSRNPKLDGRQHFVVLLVQWDPASQNTGSRFVVYDGFILPKADAFAYIDPHGEDTEQRAGIEAQIAEVTATDIKIAFLYVVCRPEKHDFMESSVCHLHRLRYKEVEQDEDNTDAEVGGTPAWLTMAKMMTSQGMTLGGNSDPPPYTKFASFAPSART